MAIDTPAKILILGAGPIGLETALYARFLGYDVQVLERGRVAEHVRQWGHVRLFSPFSLNSSSLGRSALAAQDEQFECPPPDALLTGQEWVERYLQPLADSDLLSDCIRTQCTVVAVGRSTLGKQHSPAHEERGDDDFRILVANEDGTEQVESADVVIDTTGVFANPSWMGAGGVPAVGERACREHVQYHLPDVAARDRARYAGRHTLVVGNGYSAATTVVALAELMKVVPETRVTWVVRRESSDPVAIVRRLEQDRLPERDRLAQAANALVAEPPSGFELRAGTMVQSIAQSGDPAGYRVELSGLHAGEVVCDEVIANVGYRPDVELFRELQVHLCYATDGPIKLAASLQGQSANDCLDVVMEGVDTLRNPEPDFYILGSKSYGRNSHFLMANGLEQIRQLFTLIGDREDLNLYETADRLPQ